jgi:hypothetical protein
MLITASKEGRPESNNTLALLNIFRYLWNFIAYYCFQKSPYLELFLSQINSIHIYTSIVQIYFNIVELPRFTQ